MSAPTEAQRAFCERIGWEFWGLVEAIERLGWEAPSSAVPYVRGMRSPVVDLILWQAGNDRERKAAQERLVSCLPEWRPVLHDSINATLKGRAA